MSLNLNKIWHPVLKNRINDKQPRIQSSSPKRIINSSQYKYDLHPRVVSCQEGESGSSSDSDENEDTSEPPDEVQQNQSDQPQPSFPELVPKNLAKTEPTHESIISSLPETQKPIKLAESNPAISENPKSLPVPPLVTPSGVGYASTPDGMILGLLQGPNITQPQLVAIPVTSVGNLSPNIGIKTEDSKTS
nr:unnamed protein product [Callosobruchus chinensis]